jgi:hypothetical protein
LECNGEDAALIALLSLVEARLRAIRDVGMIFNFLAPREVGHAQLRHDYDDSLSQRRSHLIPLSPPQREGGKRRTSQRRNRIDS